MGKAVEAEERILERKELVIEGSGMGREQAGEIAGWARSAGEARDWAGSGTGFPVRGETVLEWGKGPDVHGFVGRMAEEIVAYGEVWVDRDEGEVELARIIVKPEMRGKGIGCEFVLELFNKAAGFGFEECLLRVVPENLAAIGCYRRAGFVEVSELERDEFNQGQPTEYVWMRK